MTGYDAAVEFLKAVNAFGDELDNTKRLLGLIEEHGEEAVADALEEMKERNHG